jgi:hypothetical protein
MGLCAYSLPVVFSVHVFLYAQQVIAHRTLEGDCSVGCGVKTVEYERCDR